MNFRVLTAIAVISLLGCQSTYSPKLSQNDKQLKKMILSNVKKDDEFRKYVDMMFVKSCEELHKYMEPRDISLVSVSDKQTTVLLPSGRTVDLKSTHFDCVGYDAI